MMRLGPMVMSTINDMNNAQDSIDDGTIMICKDNNRVYIKTHGEIIGISPAKRKTRDKREIRELKCKNCGAPLTIKNNTSIIKCEYCGSVYDIDWDMDIESEKEEV